MNEKRHNNKITVFVFIILITVMFCMMFAQVIIKNLLMDKLRISNKITDWCVTGGLRKYIEVPIDWEEEYPHEVNEKQVDNQEQYTQEIYDDQESKIINNINKFLSKWNLVKTNVEEYSSNFLPYNFQLQAISAMFDEITGNKMLDRNNTYMKLQNGGYIVCDPFKSDETIEYEFINENLEKTLLFSEYLRDEGIPFVYFQAPEKISNYNLEYTNRYGEDQNNQVADMIIECFINNGIDCVDLRNTMITDEETHEQFFYKNESHWNTYAGFTTARVIADYLKDNYGIENVEAKLDEEQYDSMIYKKALLGDHGHAVTLARTKKEDITFYIPKFETNYHITVPNLSGITEDGSFEEVMFDYDVLRTNSYYCNPYGAMLYLKPTLVQIHNKSDYVKNTGKRILVIRESFSSVVLPYLSTQYEYLDGITIQTFDGSVKTYIEQTKPDAVVMLYTCHGKEGFEWYNVD